MGSHRLQRFSVIPNVLIFWITEKAASLSHRRINANKPRGVLRRHASQEQSIGYTEDGNVSSHTEGDCDNSNGGEAGRVAHHAQAVANVLQKVIEPDQRPDFPRLFPGTVDIAEFAQCRAASVFRQHSALDVVQGLPLNVIVNLLIQLLQHSLAASHVGSSLSRDRRTRITNPRLALR